MLRKIAFVVFSLRGGGAERVVSQLSNELAVRLEVSIIQLSDTEPFYRLDDRVRDFRYVGSNTGLLRYVGLARYLYTTFRRVKPDVVVSFGETISPFVIAVAKIARVPVVASNRASPLSSLQGRRGWLNPMMFRFADAVLVQTRRAIDILSSRFRGCRWIVMENPVRVPDEVPPDRLRENICVSVGYLGDKKNQSAVIRAFAQSAPSDWSLVIVGDGPDRAALECLARESGIDKRVQFTGAVDDVYSILLRAQVFAFASRSEGFPNALAEAMACGCACISYDCMTGPAELIDQGSSGLLVDLDDEHALASGLQRLMNKPSLREQLSTGARQRAKELCVARISERFLDSITATIYSGRPGVSVDRG